MGWVWRLVTTTGSWALKEVRPDRDPEAIEKEVAVVEAVRRAGVPVAAPRRCTDGDVVVVLDERWFRLYEWVELGPPVPTPVPGVVCEEVGALLALIHRTGGPSDDEPASWYTTTPTPDEWAALVDDGKADGQDWAGPVAAQLDALAAVHALVSSAPPLATVTTHADFHRHNVLPRADGSLVVLDWDNVGVLPPGRELAKALLQWCTEPVTSEAVRGLVRGYDGAAGPGRVADRSDFAVELSVRTNYLAGCARDTMGDDEEQRDYARSAMEPMLARPFGQRLAEIDQILGILAT